MIGGYLSGGSRPHWERRSGSPSRWPRRHVPRRPVIERLALRAMVGQPVIMIIMLTLGLEILLRGLGAGALGRGLKRLDLGISQKPLVLGDMLINRAYFWRRPVALVAIGALRAVLHTRGAA